MAKEKEMTLGELIYSEQFQTRLKARIKEWFNAYDLAVKKLEGRPGVWTVLNLVQKQQRASRHDIQIPPKSGNALEDRIGIKSAAKH